MKVSTLLHILCNRICKKKKGYYSNELSYLYGVLILEVPGVSFKAYLRRTGFGLASPPSETIRLLPLVALAAALAKGTLDRQILVFPRGILLSLTLSRHCSVHWSDSNRTGTGCIL